MTAQTALRQGCQLLDEAGIPVPRLTAEVLLSHALGCERAHLYGHPEEELSDLAWLHYGRYLHERLQGKPTQYITHRQEFYGREFTVGPDVLIPRPETEHVVETALAHMHPGDYVLDIGTGSGCIAITLALESKCTVFATDISKTALNVAVDNARRLQADVQFTAGDLGSAFADGTFDIVVSNPPYVALRDRASLQIEVREHDPALALFGGDDGLEVYHRLIPEAARLLKLGGLLIMELGDAKAVREMIVGWSGVEIVNDLAGIPRVAVTRKPH
jgi:release factor glutamine methyltransferase